jgi:hypothetical protein
VWKRKAIQQELDRKNRYHDYIELGMCDPNDPDSYVAAMDYITSLEFDSNIYAGQTLSYLKPPKSVFIPTREFARKMMRALIDFGKTDPRDVFFARFGLLENHY